MPRPYLFQQIEPNASEVLVMDTYKKKQDQELMIKWQSEIEKELWKILAEGEETKLFLDLNEGKWFGSLHEYK
jgi:hypothetical protein